MSTVPTHQRIKTQATGGTPTDLDGFAERVSVLPVEDKADLLDLILALPGALGRQDKEEADSIFRTIGDIFTGQRAEVELVKGLIPQTPEEEKGSGPKEWKAFISHRIIDLRDERGWTQAQLAERAGLTQSHISRIERQQHSPSRKTIEKLAVAFGVKVGELDPSGD